jgi:integrase/recombinase XerD
MKLTDQIELFIIDWRNAGRMRSGRTEQTYRSVLMQHSEIVQNRDLRKVGRDDIKRTLALYPGSPNTRNRSHSILSAFYTWAEQEGIRNTNPVRQVARARKIEPSIYRLTDEEVRALLAACQTVREHRVIYLGLLAGPRNQELRGFRGEHFARPGWVWISSDIAKGGRERYIPVLEELRPVVDEIRENVAMKEFVIAHRWCADPPFNTDYRDDPSQPASAQAVWRLVVKLGKRAGINHHIHPHTLRHAFAGLIRRADIQTAQSLLGHKDITTTMMYIDRPSLDDLTVGTHGLKFANGGVSLQAVKNEPVNTEKATTGIEPVNSDAGSGTGSSSKIQLDNDR